MPNLYLISTTQPNLFHVTTTNNITRYLAQLEKFSQTPLADKYQVFDVTENNLADTLAQYHLHNQWYQIEKATLLTAISQIIEPLASMTITKQATYQCKHCQIILSDRRSAQRHQCQTQLICPHCQKTFQHQKRFQNHLAICSPLKCDNCQKTFSSKQSLERHLENCGNWSCPVCQLTFTSKHKYSVHIDTQH